ncbi:hypothetical protein ACH0B5_17310 [Ureibacillus sp. 179-F W5.1 NHS]|uniref:Uncharacterized protein n=1 Tax=Lysinibacillus halotolerans TaxID=1368476 RepID=A0A3M8H1K5_9BACI|nr:hypothetical protein [Lysinibacillus halotolerans]RNC96337.1 hypothetical protein EC501_16760 [Lysinibacillus halotolerans]
MNKKRYRRNLLALLFILITAIAVLFAKWYFEVNQYHDIEDENSYSWQRYMNEDEFTQLEDGMSYSDVVRVAKGRGEKISEDVYIWDDELLLTQSYEIHFQDGKLEQKKIIQKRGYSSR